MPPSATYSLLACCVGLFAFGYWVSGKTEPKWALRLGRYGPILQIAALVAAYAVLRPGSGDDGPRDLAVAAEQGRPIFVDVYSNF